MKYRVTSKRQLAQRLPLSARRQLAEGKPNDSIRQAAWAYDWLSFEQRYSKQQISPAFHVRRAVELMKSLMSAALRHEPFALSSSVNQTQSIYPSNFGDNLIALFRAQHRREVRKIKDSDYPNQDLHPYFELLLEEIETGLIREDANGIRHRLEYDKFDAAVAAKLSMTRKLFEEHADIALYRTALNQLFLRIRTKIGSDEFRAKVTAFERQPASNRRRVMRYVSQLIKHAPRTRVVHLTILKNPELYGNPVSHDEISQLRERLTQYLRTTVPEQSNLGSSIFLRKHPRLGYCLDAFIFLSDSYLKPVESKQGIADDLTTWLGTIAPNVIQTIAHVSPTENLVTRILERITLVTELDFYISPFEPGQIVNGKKPRRFWCTQFPVDKLAPQPKRSKRQSKKVNAVDPLANLITEVEAPHEKVAAWDLIDEYRKEADETADAQREMRWHRGVRKTAAKRVASREKGAKKNAARKARVERVKRRMMRPDDVIDVEATVINVTPEQPKQRRRSAPAHKARAAKPKTSASYEAHVAAAAELGSKPEHGASSAESLSDNGTPATDAATITPHAPVLDTALPLSTPNCDRPATTETISGSPPPTSAPGKYVSEIKILDANGNERTIITEVRRKRASNRQT